jgi:hypothetical protein
MPEYFDRALDFALARAAIRALVVELRKLAIAEGQHHRGG